MKKWLSLGIAILVCSCSLGEEVPEVPEQPVEEAPVVEETTPEPQEQQPVPTEEAIVQYANTRVLELVIPEGVRSGRKGAEVWYRIDGGAWVNHGLHASTIQKTRFLAPRDGDFDFVYVPVDANDKRLFIPDETTVPSLRAAVDTTAPVVEVLAPNGGEVCAGGRTTVVRWTAIDAHPMKDGVRIELSTTGGNTWIPIARDLPNSGTYHWDIPRTSSERFKIRVRVTDAAGNAGEDESDGVFIVDGIAPEVRIQNPKQAREIPVQIDYVAEDLGGSGIQKVQLYVTRDNGLNWKFHSETADAGKPVEFKDLDGVYGLMLVGIDRVGNSSLVPGPGAKPAFTLTLDRTKPEVKLLEPSGKNSGIGNSPFPIAWIAKDNVGMPENGISLAYSDDGGTTWKTIDENVLNTGRYDKWAPPRTEGDRYRVRVRARDMIGNIAEVVSEPFGVDIGAPEGYITSAKQRFGDHAVRVEYDWRNARYAKIDRVELWYAHVGGPELIWQLYGTDPDCDKVMWFRKPDGDYRVTVVVSTKAARDQGIEQKPPEAGMKAGALVTVDFTPPQLELVGMKTRRSYAGSTSQDVMWKYVDAHPDVKGIDILLSENGGKDWMPADEKSTGLNPSDGAHIWRVPNVRGVNNVLRIVARDQFGNESEDRSVQFTIDADAPNVSIRKTLPRWVNAHSIEIPYRATDDAGAVKRVELWSKRKDGKPRRAAVSSEDEGTFFFEVIADDHYEVMLVATDESGRASGNPMKEWEAHHAFAFDTIKPVLKILNPDWITVEKDITWAATDNLAQSPEIRLRLEYRVDSGRDWFVLHRSYANVGAINVNSIVEPGRRYRFRLTAMDPAGNETQRISDDILPENVAIPPLKVGILKPNDQYPVGSSPLVSWSSPDGGIHTATLQIRKGGGDFQDVRDMTEKVGRLDSINEVGKYSVRFRARDLQGRDLTSPEVPFEIVDLSGHVQIITQFVDGSVLEPASSWKVIWRPSRIEERANVAELQIVRGNIVVSRFPVTGADAIISVPDEEGEYAVRLYVEEKDDKVVTSNHIRFKVSYKTKPPHLKMLTFLGGGYYVGGRGYVIGLEHENVDLSQVGVLYSDDGGKSWRRIPPSRLTPIQGGIYWNPIPKALGTAYRVKVEYDHRGRTAGDESESDFTIDPEAPTARVTGPKTGRRGVKSVIRIESRPSIAPIDRHSLWMTEDNGETWEFAGSFDVNAPAVLEPRNEGKVGLYATARSKTGLSSQAPEPGMPPQFVMTVGQEDVGPVVGKITLSVDLSKGTFKGGEKVTIKWEAEGTGSARMRIDLVLGDGAKYEVVSNEALRGHYSYALPKVNTESAKFVAEVTAPGATPQRNYTRDFSIDSSAPDVTGVHVAPLEEGGSPEE